MKKLIIRAGIIFVVIFTIFGATIAITLSQNMREIRALPINDYNLSTYEDGDYIGSYYYKEDQLGAKVIVTINDGNITNIDIIEHITTRGQDAEFIIDDMIHQKKIDVDAISGATTSSHVIKLAVSNALEVK